MDENRQEPRYEVPPELELVKATYNTVIIDTKHPDSDSESFDWIVVYMPSGESKIFTSKRLVIAVDDINLRGKTVEYNVRYRYDGKDTLPSIIQVNIPNEPDMNLFIDIDKDRYKRIPDSNLYIDPISMCYVVKVDEDLLDIPLDKLIESNPIIANRAPLEATGETLVSNEDNHTTEKENATEATVEPIKGKARLASVILSSDPNLDKIKALVTEDQFLVVLDRLRKNPYDKLTYVDMLTGLIVTEVGIVVRSQSVDYDKNKYIAYLQEEWLKRFIKKDEEIVLPEPKVESKDVEKAESDSKLASYVLSKNFYAGNRTKMTIFEQEVYKYVRREQLNPDILMALYKEFPSWPTVDKYYKLPILVLMLKDYIASVRTEI
jgi:hypothetical protein